ncbi:hypothetical protein FRC10_002130 [Ceratobasidium sp. 414]|nr:hypothetical protein FRC10_002130 [Ceratobasidium sp. 414]
METDAYEEVEKYILDNLNLPQGMEDVQYSVTDPSRFADVFKTRYVGTAASDLYQHLGQLQHEFISHPGHYYAKFCAIVQSSGTGKSRALVEVRRFTDYSVHQFTVLSEQLKDQGAIVVYLNLRSHGEGGDPYPGRDEVPARILTMGLEDCTEQQYDRRCTAFLAALLQLLKKYLLDLWREVGSREKVVQAWSQRMCDMTNDSRGVFFSELDTIYKAINGSGKAEVQKDTLPEESTAGPSTTPNEQSVPRMTPSSSAELASKGQPSALPPTRDPAPDLKPGKKVPGLHGESAMINAYKDLVKALPDIFNTGSHLPSLVVAIDEAHPLREPQKLFLPSHILSRAISSLSLTATEVPFWFIFASTTSEVADFSAPADMHASLRVSIGGKLLFPPYYDFGWDQYALDLTAVEPEKVALFSHIVRFGRPLWHSLAESDLDVCRVLQTAGQKLCAGQAFHPDNLHQALAVIGQRCLLDICLGSHVLVQIHHIGVSSHLRVCLWTSEDRTLMESAYPSEPLLSCAAAQLLYPPAVPTTSDTFLQILGTALGRLQRAVADRIIDQGLKGELILLTAKDIAIRKYRAASSAVPSMPEELLDCTPLPVIEYLTVLFGEDTLDDEARRLLDGWNVNFSHWIGMDEHLSFRESDEVPNPAAEMTEWLLCNWYRTSAVQCCNGQHSIDKLIPMYKLRKPSEPRSDGDPDAGRVSFILISDKNQAQAQPASAVGNVTPESAHLPALHQPYIAVLADLGAPKSNTITEIRDGRILIHAFGPGRGTYPFLTGTMADIVRDILHMRHPTKVSSLSKTRLKKLVRFGHSSERSTRRWWN